jgi:catechol 2,3-dioxygenase-like lactoylglutathione lyase family enzyme
MMTQSCRFSRGLSEIVLIVSDVRKSAQFYREVVGLAPATEANEEWAWFWAGPPETKQRIAVHRGSLLFEEQSPLPAGQRWGKVHYAFEVPPADLEAAVGHVRAAGVEVYGPTWFQWMRARSYYFYDPDGNLLEWWSPDSEGPA